MSEQEGIDYFDGVREITAGLDGAEVIRGFLAGIKNASFDFNAPLPPMPDYHGRSWEPAARRYRDIEPEGDERA